MPATARKTTTPKVQTRKRVAKKPKGHVANLEMIDRFNAAKRDGSPFTYKEFARLFFYQWKVKQGDFTDFPEQRQSDGATNLFNFLWNEEGFAIGETLWRNHH